MIPVIQKLALQDGNNVVTTIHRNLPLSAHNIYSEVAIVTIQEILLWLPAFHHHADHCCNIIKTLFEHLQRVLSRDISHSQDESIKNKIKWHFTMWHTTKMFGGTCAFTTHLVSPVLYHRGFG